MAVYTLTPAQLRGAGIYNSFEIPAGGGSSFASINSFEFDGTDDYIETTSTFSLLDGQSKATISLWIKPPSTIVNFQVIASVIKDAITTNHQFQIRLATNGTIQFSIDTGSKYIRASSTPLTLNAWNHVMFCIDTTQGLGANRGRIFINGTNATSAVTLSGALATSTGALNIARNENGDYNNYEGNVDEFALWSGTDLRSEVSAVYNGGIPGDLNNSGLSRNPDLWYRMGENATWTGREFNITDAASNNNGISFNMGESAKTTDVPS